MIWQIPLLEDPFIFNFLLFFILLAVSYLFAVFLNMKKFISVLTIHAVLTFMFAIMSVIDIGFIIIAIIELVVILKINVGYQNGQSV